MKKILFFLLLFFSLFLIINCHPPSLYNTNNNNTPQSSITKWTRLLGANGANTEARGIAIDSSNNIYVCGWTNGNLDNQTKTGTKDLFVTNKVSP